MLEILAVDFVQNALIASFLISIAAGIIGSVVVINKMSFAAGGVAHGAYAGVGVAFFAGFAPFLGALGAAVILGLLIAFFSFEKNERFDSLIGAIWAFGMALGIVFSELSDGYTSDLMSYLFGSILAVSKADLALMAGFDLLFLLFAILLYPRLCAFSFDSEFARLRGVGVKPLYYTLCVLIALCVVMSIQIVGLVLVIALLTIAPSIAERFAKSLAQMMIYSALFAFVFCVLGLVLAFYLNLSSGASIIIIATLVFFMAKFKK